MSLSNVLSKIDNPTKTSGRGSRRKGLQPSFKSIVDMYLEHRTKFNDYKGRISRNEKIGFHPSGMLNACPRQIAFQFILEKGFFKKSLFTEGDLAGQSHNSRLAFIFDLGHAVHFLIQYGYLPDIARKYNIKYDVEVPSTRLYDKYLIGGTSDIKILLQDNNWWVVDIKTMASKSFYALKTKQDFIEKYPLYVSQLMLYLKGQGLKHGLFYLVCKDNSDTKEFLFEYDEKLIKKELTTALTAKAFLQGKSYSKILPECKNKTGKYKDCAFSSLCFQVKNKESLITFTTKKKNSELIK